jgi:hypothetical protein
MASDGTSSDSTGYTRRWLLSSVAIGTGATVIPGLAQSLVPGAAARGRGGITVGTAIINSAEAGIEPPAIVLGSNTTYPPPLSVDTDIDFSGEKDDVLRFQASTNLAFSSPFIDVTIGLGDYSASSFEIAGLSAIESPNETYFRSRIERGPEHSAWSAIVKHGDASAPRLSSPAGRGSSITVTSDEGDGTLFFAILPAAASAPTADMFIAGTTGGIAAGVTNSPVEGVNTFAIGTIEASLSSASASASGPTSAALSVTVSGGLGMLYAYVSKSSTPPSDSDLMAGRGAAAHASQAVTSLGRETVAVGGLEPNTPYFGHVLFVPSGSYKAHFFQKDLSGNESNVVSTSAFTMTSPAVRASGHGFTTTAPIPAPQFDPAQVASGLTLSNGNRTLRDKVGGAWRLAMGATRRNSASDARCFSVLVNHVASQPAVGVANPGVPLNSPVSRTAAVSVYTSTGAVTYNNSAIPGHPTYTDGDVITAVVKRNQLWFLKNGVSINGVPGVSGGFFLNGADVVPFCGLTAVGDQLTLTTTASPPAGVVEWEA